MRQPVVPLFVVAMMTSVTSVVGADPESAADSAAVAGQPHRYTVQEIVIEETRLSLPMDNEIATKLPLSNRLTPASVSVLNRPRLESQGAVVLGDALRNVAGAQAQTGFGIFDYFLLRGFDSLTSSLVLIDGVAEPEASFYHLYNVESVEILKGPAAFLYGGNPMSGAVNLVSKRPLVNGPQRISTSYGSHQTRRLSADVGWAPRESSPWAARLNGMWSDSDGYRNGRDNRSFAINPSLAWQDEDDTENRARLSLEIVDQDFTTDVGLPLLGDAVADVPRRRSYQSPFDQSEQSIKRLRFDAQRRLGGVTIRNKLYVTDFDWPSTGTLLTGVVPNAAGGLDVSRILQSLDDQQVFLGNQLEVTAQSSLRGIDHRWLLGVELARQTDEFTLDVSLLPSLDLVNPQETAALPLFALQSQSGDARSLIAGFYGIDRIALSPVLHLFLGGRFDIIDYQDSATDTERSYEKLSPMAGLTYQVQGNTTFYVSFGRAFGPPSSLVVGERKAEESQQVEVGVKRDIGDGRASLSLAAYQLEKDDIAIPDLSGVTREQGDQRSRGLELEAQARLRPRWFAFLTYAYTDAELTEFREQTVVGVSDVGQPIFGVLDRSGNRAPFVPDHTMTLWMTAELTRGLGIAGGGRWVSDHVIAPDNAFEIDAYLTLEAAIFQRWNRGRLSLQLKNLTDTTYETRGFGSTSVIPADPLSAFVVLDWWL
jgi:TonB-dependent siderophore receptor